MMELAGWNRFRSEVSKALACPRRPASRCPKPHDVEVLERRELLSTFTVTNLHSGGAGSLRLAILAANDLPGPDTIDFNVAGTIRVGRKPLPIVYDTLAIDGTSAPTFAGSPVVTVDFQGTQGLRFAGGAGGSELLSLSLVRASCSGVRLDVPNVTVQGNYIGLLGDGTTLAGNRGDGIRINAQSYGDLIGRVNPVSGVTYYNADSVGLQPVSGWQGIRDSGKPGQYLIAGTSASNGLLYIGPISGAGGTSYAVNYPGATTTSVYGPDIVGGDVLRLVGSYKTGNGQVQGFLFQGTLADLSNAGNYRTIDYPNAQYTYVHSTMGSFAVGNADGPEGNAPIGTGHAFLYSVPMGRLVSNIVYPGSASTTAYGIWYNGGTSYTICGGYTLPGPSSSALAAGYLVDYDAATGQFTHWTSISAPGVLPNGQSIATHFEGISSPEPGVYTLATGETAASSGAVLGASLVTVRRNADGSFGPTYWLDLSYPGAAGVTTANAVAGNQVVGITAVSTGIIAYQATVNLEFQLSNVISGNGGNGINLRGASGNQIAMNDIGTDATGTLPRGNRQNGILLTQGASRNTIGGPVLADTARPPQGNLIAYNHAHNVLSTDGATNNLIIGNILGASGSRSRP